MKVVCGTARVVFLTGHYAVKFPRVHYLLEMAKIIPGLIVKKQWISIPNNCKRCWYRFCKGIRQNVSEYRCWQSCRAKFLVPTYFSIGVMNVQKLECGIQPTRDEMNILIREMGKQTKNQVLAIDPHCFEPKGYLKNEHGYRIVDYGNSSETPLRFTDYIVKWHKELNAIFCAKTPPA